MSKRIYEYSIGYNLVRSHSTFYLRLFYRNTTILGSENIPKNKPVIFAINHQNALMDALTTLSAFKQQPVFMARADIFQSPLAAKILRWMKILPIFRMRDGVKNLQNNEAIFKEAVSVLQAGKHLGIFPEGNHAGQRRLRVLKKGIARIAFKAEEQKDFKLDIHIVPIGLDYTNYINFGGDLLVNIGKPFTLKTYKEAYLENEQKGMTTFMQDLRIKMLPQMLHINDGENYDGIKAALDFYFLNQINNRGLKANHLERVQLQQKVSDTLIELKNTKEEDFNSITEKALKTNDAIKKLNFRQWVLAKDKYPFAGILFARLLQLILFPVYLYGFVTNIIQFQLPVLMSKGVKDPQFLSSFRFGLGLFVFSILYLIYLISLLVFIPNCLLAVAISATIPIAGIISFKYYRWFKKTSAKFRYNRLSRKSNGEWLEMQQNYKELIVLLNEMMTKK